MCPKADMPLVAAGGCTSHVDRQNLNMRRQIRRSIRLTSASSKKRENLWASLCLHFVYYDFCRLYSALCTTPAMAAGIASEI